MALNGAKESSAASAALSLPPLYLPVCVYNLQNELFYHVNKSRRERERERENIYCQPAHTGTHTLTHIQPSTEQGENKKKFVIYIISAAMAKVKAAVSLAPSLLSPLVPH